MSQQGVHMNGLIHSQSNSTMGHIPPPPPGFVQPNPTHMNSFGKLSKLIDFEKSFNCFFFLLQVVKFYHS